MSAPRPPAAAADDLDDLDDLLDSFSPSPLPAPAPPAPSTIPPPPSRPAPQPPVAGPEPPPLPTSEADFLAQLLASAGIDDADDLPPLTEEEKREVERLAEMFAGMGVDGPSDEQAGGFDGLDMEEMVRRFAGEFGGEEAGELPSAPAPPAPAQATTTISSTETTITPTTATTTSTTLTSTPSTTTVTSTTATATATASTSTSTAAPHPSFQSAIQSTLSRLQQHSSSAPPSSSSSDPLADLLGGMGDMGDMGGEDGMAGMQGMLEGMLRQLMSREVLYDSLKELSERYPSYLSSHPSLPTPDLTRYTSQQTALASLLSIFDDPAYDDSDPEWGMKVVEGMNRLQELGSPPKEIMGDMPDLGGLSLGPDGMPRIPGMDAEGCVVM